MSTGEQGGAPIRPLFSVPDHQHRGTRAIYGLRRDQYRDVTILLRRYYAWDANGRGADPWASGVGRGSWVSDQRVRTNAPESRPPGTCTPPEADSELLAIAQELDRLPSWQRQLCRLKVHGDGARGLGCDVIAERLQISQQQCKAGWREAATRLHYRLQAV